MSVAIDPEPDDEPLAVVAAPAAAVVPDALPASSLLAALLLPHAASPSTPAAIATANRALDIDRFLTGLSDLHGRRAGADSDRGYVRGRANALRARQIGAPRVTVAEVCSSSFDDQRCPRRAMTDTQVEDVDAIDGRTAAARLSTLDRWLPAWIGAAMVLGIGLGRAFPDLNVQLEKVKVDTVSLPIAIGLFAMMYPVLAKVRYGSIGHVVADRRSLAMSLALNWLIGPAVMFALAWLMLPDLPEYRTGLVIVGLARCIAMVLIWNDLACGNRELAAVLVAVNSLFQIAAYSVLGWFYLELLPGWLGLDSNGIDVTVGEIAKSVLIFLGVPLLAGFLTRALGERAKGTEWYEGRFLPRIGPFALYGLLFTIVILFALQGDRITSQPLEVARIALPLLAYFAIMWFGAFGLGVKTGLPYDRNASIAFTAAGNNFELAIAVAIGVFGVSSGQALAGVVGPLIEVPVLVGLVYVALWARRRFYRTAPRPGTPGGGRP
jgi:ACR3 family arsenite transporter